MPLPAEPRQRPRHGAGAPGSVSVGSGQETPESSARRGPNSGSGSSQDTTTRGAVPTSCPCHQCFSDGQSPQGYSRGKLLRCGQQWLDTTKSYRTPPWPLPETRPSSPALHPMQCGAAPAPRHSHPHPPIPGSSLPSSCSSAACGPPRTIPLNGGSCTKKQKTSFNDGKQPRRTAHQGMGADCRHGQAGHRQDGAGELLPHTKHHCRPRASLTAEGAPGPHSPAAQHRPGPLPLGSCSHTYAQSGASERRHQASGPSGGQDGPEAVHEVSQPWLQWASGQRGRGNRAENRP